MTPKIATVMGRRIPKPRLDWGAVWVGLVYGVGPVLGVGLALDIAAQSVFGVCTGLWCVVR